MSEFYPEEKKWWQAKTARIIILVAIGLAFLNQSLEGEMLNYDDERYIAQNELIESLDAGSIAAIFTSYFDGHYHPITMLSLSLDRVIFKNSVKGHHTINLFLHLFNSALVYLFLLALFKQDELALAVAFLFMLHPMTVESYAWMTERKNVLYSTFFLLAGIKYLRYLEAPSRKALIICFVFFALSILSKAQAMTFLGLMFLLDYLRERNLRETKIYLEKLPFLALAVAFILLTAGAQAEAWGDLNTTSYGQTDKLALASFAFMSYLVKGLVPFNLSAYYPYPSDYGAPLEWQAYASIVGVLIFLFLVWKAFQTKRKVVFFGLAFFFINVVLMLKYLDVPYGNYYMANRYNYLPLIGLLLIPTYYLAQWIQRKEWPLAVPVALIAFVFGVQANARISVWNNSVSLWSDVIGNYPKYGHAYNMRALGYIAKGKTEAAANDFIRLTNIDPDFPESYLNLAILYYKINDISAAEVWVDKALEIFKKDHRFYHLSANIRMKTKDYYRALSDINSAIKKTEEPNLEYHFTRAQIYVQLGQPMKAMDDLDIAASLPKASQLMTALQTQHENRKKPDVMVEHAVELAKRGQIDAAMKIFNEQIQIDPRNKAALINRGSTYGRLGEYEQALQDFIAVRELDADNARVHYLLGVTYRDLDRKEEACASFKKASQQGWELDQASIDFCNN